MPYDMRETGRGLQQGFALGGMCMHARQRRRRGKTPPTPLGCKWRATQAWGDTDVLVRVPVPQQAYMTHALALLLQRLGRAGVEAAPRLLPLLLSGVSARLDSPLDPVR